MQAAITKNNQLKQQAKPFNIPAFNVSYLKPETAASYQNMNDVEKKELENKWYQA